MSEPVSPENTSSKTSSGQSTAIVATVTDKIMILHIARGEKKNALTRMMYSQLTEQLAVAASRADIRVVVIKGHEDYFSAGNDISDFLHHPPKDESSEVLQFLRALSQFPKPLIAAANGVAVGIGTTLLLHCDYVVLGHSAILKLPFVELGLCPEAASSLLLPRHIGYLRASEMILAGAKIDASTALQWGLANQVCDKSFDDAMEVAQKMAQQPPAALVLSKRLLKLEIEPKISERLTLEGKEFVQRLTSPEAREAFTAFLQKRSPDFSQF